MEFGEGMKLFKDRVQNQLEAGQTNFPLKATAPNVVTFFT